jgi:hypothetical protein
VGFEPTQENPRTQRLKQTTLRYILWHKIWSEWRESNLHYEVPNLGDYHYHTLRNKLVQPRGIEPLSTVLQTAAMTTSAKVALVPAEGIEPSQER